VVRTSEGGRLTYASALSRSLDVWFRGFGMGIPLVSLFTLIIAHGKLTKTGVTSWDRDRGLQVTHSYIGPWRIIVAVLLFLIFAVFVALGNET
jgi:hypothetical protein